MYCAQAVSWLLLEDVTFVCLHEASFDLQEKNDG